MAFTRSQLYDQTMTLAIIYCSRFPKENDPSKLFDMALQEFPFLQKSRFFNYFFKDLCLKVINDPGVYFGDGSKRRRRSSSLLQ
jgi:hypothetical protein